MRSIFDYTDYKAYVNDRVEARPEGGYGEFGRIARALRVHPSLISQVLKGTKNFTLEQATEMGAYWGMGPFELEYFQKLILLARAGNEQTRRALESQLQRFRTKAKQVSARLPAGMPLSESDQAMFYSSWIFAAAHLATSLPAGDSIDGVSQILDLPAARVSPVVDFLLSRGLCQSRAGRLLVGKRRTHLPASSPLISRHHMNWRLKAIERCENLKQDEEIMFSSPVSVSRRDAIRIRSRILEVIEELMKEIHASPDERLSCLNMDWFTVAESGEHS